MTPVAVSRCRGERLLRQHEDFLPKLPWSIIFFSCSSFCACAPTQVGGGPEAAPETTCRQLSTILPIIMHPKLLECLGSIFLPQLTFDLLIQTSAEEQASLFWITSCALMALRSRADHRFCSRRLSVLKMTPVYSFTSGLLTFGILSNFVNDKHEGGHVLPIPISCCSTFPRRILFYHTVAESFFCQCWNSAVPRPSVFAAQRFGIQTLTTAPPCYTDGVV